MTSSNERCIVCNYCAGMSDDDNPDGRSFWLDKETNAFICSVCADSIYETIAEYEQDTAEKEDPFEYDEEGRDAVVSIKETLIEHIQDDQDDDDRLSSGIDPA